MGSRIAAILAGALLALAAMLAGAQDYPRKPVKIIVPFAAGGPADVYARFIGQKLSEAMGQPFVVDDRPGAGSVIGTDAAAKSAPDGYTLLMMSNAQTVNESLIPNKPYALMRDFVPVAPVNYSDLVLVVHPSVQANSLADLIRLAKATPGQAQLRVVGTGHAVSHGRRALQGDGRRRHPARSVQGKLRRAHRRARGRGPDDVRRGDDDERARARRHRESRWPRPARRARRYCRTCRRWTRPACAVTRR